MKLQFIKSIEGKDEYVLLPVSIYKYLQEEIKQAANIKTNEDYVPFDPGDYINNPVALARIKSHITQKELAKRMHVSQAYISKIETKSRVSAKVLEQVYQALKNKSH